MVWRLVPGLRFWSHKLEVGELAENFVSLFLKLVAGGRAHGDGTGGKRRGRLEHLQQLPTKHLRKSCGENARMSYHLLLKEPLNVCVDRLCFAIEFR